MAEIPFPRGVRDLMPNEALFRKDVLSRIEYTFRLFGFLTIETPSFESLAVLNAKNAIGSEAKLIYEMRDEKLGLRYDHTVPLARYMAMHRELPTPFRRYYIGNVWRREEPQRMRYREVMQADADIIGGNMMMADAEVIAVAAAALDSVGVKYTICLNDRQMVDSVLKKFGVEDDKQMAVMKILDRLDKAGESGVVDMLKDLKLESALVDQIIAFVNVEGGNDEKLSYVDSLLGEEKSTKGLRETLELLDHYRLSGRAKVDLSVMRGLDYYTGIVFEYKSAGEGNSVGGGGRYDNLVGIYSNSKSMPAVGVSLGVDRILDLLDFSSSAEYTYAKAFVVNVKDSNYPYALNVANVMRSSGVPTDINISARNLSNQFAYAGSIKTKYAVVVGNAEEKLNKVKLRNLITGNEEIMGVDEAIKRIKSETNG